MQKFTTIQIEQNTDAWLEFRRTKIGASDAPIIMDVSPYKKIHQLFDEKVNGTNHTVEHAGIRAGKENESFVLSLINERFHSSCKPAVILSNEHPWMIASLDGWDAKNSLAVEIKVPCKLDHELARQNMVPPKYIPQLQHQLYVLGLGSMYYCSYRDFELVTVLVMADVAYQAELLEKEKLFYKSLCTNELDQSFVPQIVQNETIDNLLQELLSVREAKKKLLTPLEEKEESLKNAIIALADNKPLMTQRCVIKSITRTTYDYKTMVVDYDVALDAYKKETTFWDIKERK